MMNRENQKKCVLGWLCLVCLILMGSVEGAVKLSLADGFDFPVGKPDAQGYYRSRGLRLVSPRHLGDDWNGRGGGDSDLGAPVYAIGEGVVTFAHNVQGAWGNVVMTRHAFRDPETKEVRFFDTLNGHLDKIMVKTGDRIKKGQQIGTIGTNFGMYPAHLHFELHLNIHIGLGRGSVPCTSENWADPTAFINKYRKLKGEWKGVDVPTGTYLPYKGHEGL